jgi:hypothetical protein
VILRLAEFEALLREVPDDPLGCVETVRYLMAATTGLRQRFCPRCAGATWSGWQAAYACRRTFVRDEFGTRKSRRSSRSVPLATRASVELDLRTAKPAAGGDENLGLWPSRPW